jgi:hypothetical protein
MKQSNKVTKRIRLKAYIKRKKEAVKTKAAGKKTK